LRLFSILLNGTSARPQEVPEKIAQNIQSLRAEHPLATHHLYHDEELRSFIAAHFGPEVVNAHVVGDAGLRAGSGYESRYG
jgi:hypothetical protein